MIYKLPHLGGVVELRGSNGQFSPSITYRKKYRIAQSVVRLLRKHPGTLSDLLLPAIRAAKPLVLSNGMKPAGIRVHANEGRIHLAYAILGTGVLPDSADVAMLRKYHNEIVRVILEQIE